MRERILPPATSSTGALSPVTEEGGPPHVLVIEDDDAVRGVLLRFLTESGYIDPDLAIVMLTGANDAATATDALSAGALDYLTKPIDWMTLGQAIGRALHKRRLITEQRRVGRVIREEVAAQTLQLRNLTVNVVETLVNAMEARDLYRRGHSQRTAQSRSIGALRGDPAALVVRAPPS